MQTFQLSRQACAAVGLGKRSSEQLIPLVLASGSLFWPKIRQPCGGGGIAISSSIDVLTDIVFRSGPKENLIALGYANWALQQLEQEIINNYWLVAPASSELVFRTKDEDKWQKTLDSLNVDPTRLSAFSGRA